MGKTIIEAPRGESTFLVMPEEVRIIGVDTTHKRGEHPLWQQRAFRQPNEASVLNMMVNGNKFVPPIQIELAEDGGWDLADGRGRVIDAREANRRLRERGAEPFALKALVKRREDVATSFERMIVPNSFATLPTLIDRMRDACAALDRGVPEERVALLAGVGVPQLRQWKMLHDAPEVLAHVESGELSLTTGVQIAKKPPALQKRALESALGRGKRTTRRELEAASGKPLPPTRKQLRRYIADIEKRHDELSKRGEDNPILAATLAALRFAYAGGEPPAVLRELQEDPQLPKNRTKREQASALADIVHSSVEEAIMTYGLTDRASKVFDPAGEVETISSRLEAAGFHIDNQLVSKVCAAMFKAGKIERRPAGYRLKRQEGHA
jgi:ParB family chromosome partitioning protein